jgi:hypothetical protein
MMVSITEQELNVRKSNGAVWICRSCKDNKQKYIMVNYDPNSKGLFYSFCKECIETMNDCIPCKNKI